MTSRAFIFMAVCIGYERNSDGVRHGIIAAGAFVAIAFCVELLDALRRKLNPEGSGGGSTGVQLTPQLAGNDRIGQPLAVEVKKRTGT